MPDAQLPTFGHPTLASTDATFRRPSVWRRLARKMLDFLASCWLVIVLLIVWEVVTRATDVRHFPPLTEVLQQFREDWLSGNPRTLFLSEHFWENAGPSLRRFGVGWALSIVVGVAAGVALGRSRVAAAMFNPLIRFSIATPKTILLPLAVTFFGVVDRMNIFLIFIGTVWVILINTMDAVATIDSMWLRSARSIGLPKARLLRTVVLPAASPQILAGIRVSLGVGLILMVISELYATTSGLGYEITLAQRTFKYLPMWSAILLVAIIGVTLNVLYDLVERRLLRWTKRQR